MYFSPGHVVWKGCPFEGLKCLEDEQQPPVPFLVLLTLQPLFSTTVILTEDVLFETVEKTNKFSSKDSHDPPPPRASAKSNASHQIFTRTFYNGIGGGVGFWMCNWLKTFRDCSPAQKYKTLCCKNLSSSRNGTQIKKKLKQKVLIPPILKFF